VVTKPFFEGPAVTARKILSGKKKVTAQTVLVWLGMKTNSDPL
jgi:hypothetical protein